MFKAEEEITNYLNTIYIPSDFGYDVDNSDEELLEDWWDDNRKVNAHYEHGCTKMVILSEDWDCCVKIGFNCNIEYVYDEDTGEMIDTIPHQFISAPGKNKNNYADTEFEYYILLCQNGLGALMPKTELFERINGHNIYLQEKVQVSWENKVHASEDSLSYIEENEFPVCTNEWDASVIDRYGLDFYKSFVDFCKKYPIFRYDMHGDNFGYAFDGRPVILDIGGYMEEDY